jgi:Xaa-Pro aminopeptidase
MSRTERIPTRISDQELQRRWNATRAAMAARNIDALIAQSSNDWLGGAVKWLTDIPATNGYPRTAILHRTGGITMVEMGAFGARRVLDGTDPIHRGVDEIIGSPAFSAIGYTNGYDGTLAAEELRRRGCRRVALVTPGALPAGFRDALHTTLDSTAFEDATDWFDAIKAVKSAEEITLIRRAAALQDQVFAAIAAAIRPGLTDAQITTLAQTEALRLGSEQGIFLGASAPLGQVSAFLPRHMQGRTLREGDHLSLLIEVNGPGGFYTEIARTLVLGRASNELLDAFEAVRAAQAHTLANLKPGIPCQEIAAAHDRYMVSQGLPPEIRLYSHGQGYDMVERPLIRRDETMALAEGMCLAVHPGYETNSLFAVICDNYMLEATGPGLCLHQTEKRIFEV